MGRPCQRAAFRSTFRDAVWVRAHSAKSSWQTRRRREPVAIKILKQVEAEEVEATELVADREARALTLCSQSERHRNVLRAEGIIDFKASSDAASLHTRTSSEGPRSEDKLLQSTADLTSRLLAC